MCVRVIKCEKKTGIWSPSGTPQPIRREFPPAETNQFKSEPTLIQSTPNTPASERREFRSVKFESPSLPRKYTAVRHLDPFVGLSYIYM